MALSKIKLGAYLEQYDIRNSDNKLKNVMGISVRKEFREPTSKVNKEELKTYKLVYPNQFASVPTTHNEKCFAFAYNDTKDVILVSSINTVFSVNEKYINPRWLQMYFNRPEFDRYARFNSWGSAREVFSWENLCDIDIDLPDLETQQKYVDIYLAMVENQKAYERGLSDLKLTCDGYIEDLRRKMPREKIGKYIEETREKNELSLKLKNKAVSNSKIFVEAKEAVFEGVETKNYLIVNKGEFAYNTVTTRNADKLSIALNRDEKCLVSPLYTTFKVKSDKLSPEYLCLWLIRDEYDRYARFNSWGSARELYSFETLSETMTPIPDIKIQQAIADIYKVYLKRKEINEKLKSRIKSLCPILIKGSLEEGR